MTGYAKPIMKIKAGRGHWYKVDGVKFSGVTTLIGDGVAKPFLIGWAAREVATYVADNLEEIWGQRNLDREGIIDLLKGKPYRTSNAAAGRGTEVHRYAEQLSAGREVHVPPELQGYVQAVVDYLDEWRPADIHRELVVANRTFRYAGTLDKITDYPGDLIRWPVRCALEGCPHTRRIVDYKTGKKAYSEVALQLAAYANAEAFLDEAGQEQPLPAVCQEAFVAVFHEYGYDLHPVYIGPEVFRAFQHVAWVARLLNRENERGLHSWLGEALPRPDRAEME